MSWITQTHEKYVTNRSGTLLGLAGIAAATGLISYSLLWM